MQVYAITDRKLFSSHEELIEQAAEWAAGGVDYVQIREKDLVPADLADLASRIVSAVRLVGDHTRVLLNGPPLMAAETGCNGVHLTANLSSSAIAEARMTMNRAVMGAVISVSCHTIPEIERARDQGASLAVFAPVFEKRVGDETIPGQGLPALAEACRIASPMPVFALGGVNARNADDCIHAGAAGIAGIRLFVSGGWRRLKLPG